MDVILVGMGNQHRIDALELMLGGEFGIAFHPRVQENHFARVETELKRCVAEPRDLKHAH